MSGSPIRAFDELAWLDAVGQAELVRRGEVTSVELVEAAIDRIERVDPLRNAVVIREFERALDAWRQSRTRRSSAPPSAAR